MSPKRRPTGLWLRGSVWQYRTRVPADLQSVLGRSHVNRSLHTSSYPDAIRAARRIAVEIGDMFDATRRGVGSDPVNAVCDGACSQPSSPSMTAATVLPAAGPTIHIDLDALADRIADKLRMVPTAPQAVTPAPPAEPVRTIQQVYDAYMADPGVIRSGKTVLGIARRTAGKYKGRKPTAKAKASQILALHQDGVGPSKIARRLDIGRASVYRILAAPTGTWERPARALAIMMHEHERTRCHGERHDDRDLQ